MAVLTPVDTSTAAAVASVAATAAGDTVANASGAKLVVTNGGTAAVTVTITGVRVCSQGATHNQVQAVAIGATEYVPVLPQCVDPATGNAAVAYSAVTSVTVSAVK